jgi:hypothetical protein
MYVVNKKMNIVSCVVDVYVETPYINGDEAYATFYQNSMPKTRVVGIAKCSPNDNFDVELGKRIAYARAENEAYQLANDWIAKTVNQMKQLVKMADAFEEKAKRCISHNKNYVHGLTDPEHPDYLELKKKREARS